MTHAEADGVASVKVPRSRVCLLCSVRCTGRIALWKDFGFVSDGRASAGVRFRITMKHGDANVYGEGASPRVMARVRITGLGCSTERMS